MLHVKFGSFFHMVACSLTGFGRKQLQVSANEGGGDKY